MFSASGQLFLRDSLNALFDGILFLVFGGLPLGLPDCPFSKGIVSPCKLKGYHAWLPTEREKGSVVGETQKH